MTSQAIGAAYKLLAEADRSPEQAETLTEQARAQIIALGPTNDGPVSHSDRALLASCLIRLGDVKSGMVLLEHDWSQATAAVAGLAGTALLHLGLIARAAPLLAAAAQDSASDAAIRLNYGRALLLNGDAEQALEQLESAAEALADNTLAITAIAEALLALGRAEEALSLPESTVNEDLIAARVRLLSAASRHHEASQLLARGREQHPNSQPLLLLSAELAEVRGRSGEATAMLLKALEKDPDNILLLCRLAHCGRRDERNPLARQAADRALHCAQDQPPQLRALALAAHAHVLSEEGHSGEAEAAYRQALELAPALPAALSGLGQLLLQTGAASLCVV